MNADSYVPFAIRRWTSQDNRSGKYVYELYNQREPIKTIAFVYTNSPIAPEWLRWQQARLNTKAVLG